MSLRFIIPGEPRAWQRAGENRGRRFNTKQHADHAKTIAQYADLAIRECGEPAALRMSYPCGGRFYVSALFMLGRYGTPPRTREYDCDVDNLAKLLLDALEGVVWHNDKQVARVCAEKVVGTSDPHTVVEIWNQYESPR